MNLRQMLLTMVLLAILFFSFSCGKRSVDWNALIGIEVNTDTIRIAPGEEFIIHYSYVSTDETIKASWTWVDVWSADTNVVKILSNSFVPHRFEEGVWYNDSLKCLSVSFGETYLVFSILDCDSPHIPVIVDSLLYSMKI